MPSRRQEKVARIVKEAISDAIANHLSDPRITGFVSVTRVELAADLRSADIYLSIFGANQTDQKKTFLAITHAKSRIQSLLADRLQSKFCPVLRFCSDEKFKKTMEIIKLINETASRQTQEDSADQEQ